MSATDTPGATDRVTSRPQPAHAPATRPAPVARATCATGSR